MFRTLLFCLLAFVVMTGVVLGSTTGKVSGIVTDSENGEPLAGVNVFLEGTSHGSATDLDGYYVILNVPPGRYELHVTYIGYAESRITDLVVKMDLTTKQDIRLKSEIIETETVIVEAERPVISRDVSNSQLNIEAETIEQLPVQTVDRVLTLQAGIELGSEGIIVRGGGPNQTQFLVDGLVLNDERSNIPYSTLSLSSVQEISIQTGGFTAEYGDLRSGLVNIVTKEGNADRYTGLFNYRISPPTRKQFGPSVYDPYSYFNRPYLDPDVCWTGTQNGAWDGYTQRQYPKFEGWNAVSFATMQDNNPDNDLSPEGAKRLFTWQRRRQGDIDKPDYNFDGGFGGPVPYVSKQLGNLRFHVSHFREQDMFVFPLSRDAYDENHTQMKITSDISSSMKLVVSGLYGEVFSVSPYSWTTTPTGRLIQSQSEIADLTNSTDGSSVIYMPGYYSPGTIYRHMIGAKLTHTLSNRTFYNLNLQKMGNRHRVYQMDTRDTSRVYEPVEGYFVDEAPYGYWGYSVSGVEGMSMGGWMNLGRDRSTNTTYTLNFDLTTQYNSKNQIKTGLKFVYNDYNIKSSTYSPSMGTWTRDMEYRVFPYRLGMYVQDKLEFEDFIANIGVRMDYSDSNTDAYSLDPYSDYYKAGPGERIDTEAPAEESKAQLTFSPRLGISHPITENSKLFFNYGHYRTEAGSSYRFRLQRESNGQVTYLGDPNIQLEKTIAYELGYEHNLFDLLLLKAAAYYKDVSNQPAWIRYINLNGQINYYRMSNNNYEDIRGFELTLTKRAGRWISGFVNYTYDVHTSGYFGLRQYWEDPNEQRNYLRLNPYQSKPRPQPYARASVNLHTPNEFGPEWFGFRPFVGWNMNMLADWSAGSYYTYNPDDIPGVIYNTRWRDYHNIDMRLSKTLNLSRYNVQFYMDVTNVFNVKRLNWAGFSDSYDLDDYLKSLNFSWEKGVEKGDDKIGDYRPVGVAYDPLEPNPDNDPEITARNNKRKDDKSYIDMPNIRSLTFLNPRDIFFGIKISF